MAFRPYIKQQFDPFENSKVQAIKVQCSVSTSNKGILISVHYSALKGLNCKNAITISFMWRKEERVKYISDYCCVIVMSNIQIPERFGLYSNLQFAIKT